MLTGVELLSSQGGLVLPISDISCAALPCSMCCFSCGHYNGDAQNRSFEGLLHFDMFACFLSVLSWEEKYRYLFKCSGRWVEAHLGLLHWVAQKVPGWPWGFLYICLNGGSRCDVCSPCSWCGL